MLILGVKNSNIVDYLFNAQALLKFLSSEEALIRDCALIMI